MSENESNEENPQNQIMVVNIKYGRFLTTKIKERPEMVTLDLPESLVKIRNKTEKFLDGVESFAYNIITRKYGAEVCNCQVFLPLDN